MLMHTREGKTIVTQREKVENETRQEMNNLFQRLCSIWSFLLSRKHHYLFATGSFHFRIGQAKLSKAFSKSSTLPWKNWQQTASWSFSWSFSPATIDFQNSPSSDFIWRRTSCDFVARLTVSRPKKLALLAKKLVKLDSAVVSMFFRSLVIF